MLVTKPDVRGARDWARAHLEQLSPHMDELMGRSGDLSYPTEILLERLMETGGITQSPSGTYEVGHLAAIGLLKQSLGDRRAFDVVRKIIAANRRLDAPIPDVWRDFEEQNTLGKLKRPAKAGPAEAGVRDLVYEDMAATLVEEYGLPLSRNEATEAQQDAPTACEVIADAMRAIGAYPPTPPAIEKAIRRLSDEAQSWSDKTPVRFVP